MGLVIRLKMCNLQEIIGFLTKIQLYLEYNYENSVFFRQLNTRPTLLLGDVHEA